MGKYPLISICKKAIDKTMHMIKKATVDFVWLKLGYIATDTVSHSYYIISMKCIIILG